MHDSGKRETGDTGAQTDPSHTNAAMELLSPYSLWNLSEYFGEGAKKYAPRNWEKGIPFSIIIGKLQRHLQQYLMGKTDEDHWGAVGWMWHALVHYEAMIALGKLPASLNDLPMYEKKFICPAGWVIRKPTAAHRRQTGWCIWDLNKCLFLHKDLTLHDNTGIGKYTFGEAPGYWPTKEAAEDALQQYLEKQKAR